MYKSEIHTINLYDKNYKISKYLNKIHMLQKICKKINILKLSSYKKGQICLLEVKNPQ